MSKLLIVDQDRHFAECLADYFREEGISEIAFADSLELAYEQFMTFQPDVMTLEIVLPDAKCDVIQFDKLESYQHSVHDRIEKLEKDRDYEKTAGQINALGMMSALAFGSQIELYDLTAGIKLLKQMKAYCEQNTLKMPKVFFLTTQSVYKYIEDIQAIYPNRDDYIWVNKPAWPEEIINSWKELVSLKSEIA